MGRPWIDIQGLRRDFTKFSLFKVSSGTSVRFWEDPWIDSVPLATSFPDLYTLSLKRNSSIAECWSAESSTWDLGLRRNFFDRKINRWGVFTEKIGGVVIGQGRDRLMRKVENSGVVHS